MVKVCDATDMSIIRQLSYFFPNPFDCFALIMALFAIFVLLVW